MNDLNQYLTLLREEPLDDRLGGLEGPVMAGLDRHRDAQVARRGLVLAGFVAVVVGFSGALAPSNGAQAAPLFAVPDSAPSHLLGF